MKLLTGKIYWVEFDFNFSGIHIPKNNKTSFTAAKITNVIIEDHMIKFNTEPPETDYSSYNVTLLINDNGSKYEGKVKEIDEVSEVEVVCELFQNSKSYFLYGKWTEYYYETECEEIYTWWARVDKMLVSDNIGDVTLQSYKAKIRDQLLEIYNMSVAEFSRKHSKKIGKGYNEKSLATFLADGDTNNSLTAINDTADYLKMPRLLRETKVTRKNLYFIKT